ncbi:antirestriction protein [Burkholderia contaminans]|uniref:antirestriction protein n=1 Tax=Burkholderia contaminans TaxID=488447 RepID=UPI001CED0145|nr:antirestriction protein [Burkholderia contaminans]
MGRIASSACWQPVWRSPVRARPARGEIAGTDAADALIDRYHFLRGFAAGTPEAAAIYRAID